MAEAVVTFAVERLGDLLISEATFLSGVSDKILEIQRLLKEMQRFLKDADNKRGNLEVGRWVAKIRELALHTEDVLETYAVKVASRREGGHIKKIMRRFACIIGECIALHKIGSQIGTIQAKITNLASSRQTFGIEALDKRQGESSTAEEERQKWLKMSYGHLIEKDFVGMEDEIERLVSHLKNEDRGCEVVSIWGMGGQGKTSLAAKLYNHTEVRSYFQAYAWVCITQQFERQRVLQDILKGLRQRKNIEEVMKMGDQELVEQIYSIQQEQKCLIVLDDIWSLDDWKILRPAFPIAETTGSKILLTTRNEKVAKVGESHKLRSLSDEEGWKLLLKKAFPGTDAATENRVKEKEKVGRDMVQKCQGLPLAISILGGLLQNKNSLKEWEMVNKDIASNLSRGEEIENGGVRHILGLSYDNLPFRLKQLFLYLGTFKEDEEIVASELYLLWIAEGMIPSGQKAKGEMLMDVAERYLVELAQRSLIQLIPTNEKILVYWTDEFQWLRIHSCYLHDLIRDLCLLKGKEEDILKKIDFRDAHNESYHSVIGVEARRLAIYMHDYADNLDNALEQQQHMVGQLRSLLLFDARFLWMKTINNLNYFKLVRVLKLDGLLLTKRQLSRGIIELIHLRYLSLKECQLEELPSCIGDSSYLETLDLRANKYMVGGAVIIPNVLWKLKRLKHLYLPYYIGVKKKLRFDGLKELELLWNFDASKCDANDLVKLTDLQVLDAVVSSVQEHKGVMNFLNSDLHHSRHTYLSINHDDFDLIQLLQCDKLNELQIEGTGSSNKIHQPYEHHYVSQSLTFIHLMKCKIEADIMALLEKLPNLQTLVLDADSFVGKELVCSANSFSQLLHLRLRGLGNLEKWRVDEGAMPSLSGLEILDCEKLEMLPEGLKFLTSLGELHIRWMPEAFSDRVRVIDGVEGQDFHKIRHVKPADI